DGGAFPVVARLQDLDDLVGGPRCSKGLNAMASEFLLRLGQLTAVASAAATVALALRPLVRRVLGSRLAYGLWVLVPLSVAAWVLPAPVAFADPIGWPTPVPARVSEARKVVTPELDEPVTAPLADNSVALVERELVARGLSLLWLLGVLAGIGLIVVRHRRALAALGELVPTERDDVFRSSRSAIGPGLYGLIRPRIVVPSDFETLFDTQQQQLIIAHERAHRRHGDTRTNAIATFGVALTWFNPIGYIALRAFRYDQELARDASVVGASNAIARP
ncbi:MAG: M56 family metallopeptidase, partial [Myxococcota bacterium]